MRSRLVPAALLSTTRGLVQSRLLPAIVFICGVALSVLGWWSNSRSEARWHQAQFDRGAQDVLTEITANLQRCDRMLAAVALWAEKGQLGDQNAWDQMADQLGMHQPDDCSEGLSWYPRIEGKDLDAFVQARRAAGLPNYTVRPPGHRALHFPLALTTATAEASRAFLGIDPYANPPRRAEMERAASRRGPTLSAWLHSEALGYFALRYVPVGPGTTPSEVKGFVGAPLRVSRLVERMQSRWSSFRVILTAEDDERRPRSVSRPETVRPEDIDDDLLSYTRAIHHGGLQWSATMEPLASFHVETPWQPGLMMLLGGIGITLLATGLIISLARSHAHARDLARHFSKDAVLQREQALRSESERQLLLERVPIGVMHLGPDDRIVSANRAAHLQLGYSDDELSGRPVSELFDLGELRHRGQLRSGADRESESTLVRKDGTRFPAAVDLTMLSHDGDPTLGCVCIFTDISERKRSMEQIRFLALHDRLTGLPNRTDLEHRVQAAFEHARDNQTGFAVMLLDLDRFKQINDTLGHSVGDQVLVAVAKRLLHSVRPTDTVARMGGDEFVVLLPGIETSESALRSARKLLDALSSDLLLDTHRLMLTTSIGIALHPQHGADMSSLLKAADLAMYRAKAAGRNGAVVYDPAKHAPDERRLLLERDLREALCEGQLLLHYQPIVDTCSGEPRALEALLRWQHPVFGMVPPCEFVPLAEETGAITPIGAWVLESSCAELARLRQRWPDLRMGVNLSVVQLFSPDLVGVVKRALDAAGIPGSALEIEITESVLVRSDGDARAVLVGLRELGVRLAVDDFGTGYSALAYLSRFPVTTLKVDRSFVSQIDGPSVDGVPPDRGALATAVVSLARSLGLHTIAEGVETLEQRQFMQRCGCEAIQGYYFSRPVSADALPAVLEDIVQREATSADAIPGGQLAG